MRTAILSKPLKPRRIPIFRKTLESDGIQPYLMLLPLLVGFALFSVYPILYVVRFAWYHYDGFRKPEWAGFYNFVRLFTREPAFWKAWVNTLIVTFVMTLLNIPFGLILAVILNNEIKGSAIFRAIIFLPTIISMAIAGLVFSILFDSYRGIVNSVLLYLGIIDKAIPWLEEKSLAMGAIIITGLWHGVGNTMIYFLMGLQGIPAELYECAQIDGAGKARQFFKITLPLLAPVTQIILLLGITGGMHTTDLVLVLTDGGPAGQTEVVMTYVFKKFFSYGGTMSDSQLQFGYASAAALVAAILLSAISYLFLRLSKNMEGKNTF
jgi:raffinose/stachyose/melibiose transport system permease protein